MRFRKLRIAWSVAWGLACVLLIVLWVRSYWWCDTYSLHQMGNVQLSTNSLRGEIVLNWNADRYGWDGQGYRSYPASEVVLPVYSSGPYSWFRFETRLTGCWIILPM